MPRNAQRRIRREQPKRFVYLLDPLYQRISVTDHGSVLR
jgi:hypothetical protein